LQSRPIDSEGVQSEIGRARFVDGRCFCGRVAGDNWEKSGDDESSEGVCEWEICGWGGGDPTAARERGA